MPASHLRNKIWAGTVDEDPFKLRRQYEENYLSSFIKHCPLLAYENCQCASAVGTKGAGYGLRIHTCSYYSCHLAGLVSRQNATKPWAVSEGLSVKF